MFNLDHKTKNLLKKDQMESHLEDVNQANILLNYASDDVVLMSEIPNLWLERINEIYKSYNFPDEWLLTHWSLPMTNGSITANFLEKFLYKELCFENGLINWDLFERFQKINKKLGVKKKFKLFNHEKLSVKGQRKDECLKISRSLNTQSGIRGYQTTLQQAGSVNNYSFFYKNTTGILNSLVSGGRTFNEQPDKYLYENIADLDFNSCYGSALTEFVFPVGVPTVLAYTNEQESLTLKEFLEKYKTELVDNLYTITISGMLNFEQNLIYSKLLTLEQVYKRILKQELNEEFDNDLEDSTFDSDFVILTKEICNGILTSDILTILKKICTSQEWNQILQCKVVTASMYLKSDRVDDRTVFFDILEKSDGSYIYDVDQSGILDQRSKKWFPIPLKNLVQPLLDQRKFLKKLMKTESDPEKIKFQSRFAKELFWIN
jgi:hypothetical protein